MHTQAPSDTCMVPEAHSTMDRVLEGGRRQEEDCHCIGLSRTQMVCLHLKDTIRKPAATWTESASEHGTQVETGVRLQTPHWKLCRPAQLFVSLTKTSKSAPLFLPLDFSCLRKLKHSDCVNPRLNLPGYVCRPGYILNTDLSCLVGDSFKDTEVNVYNLWKLDTELNHQIPLGLNENYIKAFQPSIWLSLPASMNSAGKAIFVQMWNSMGKTDSCTNINQNVDFPGSFQQ